MAAYAVCVEAGGCTTDGLTDEPACNWGKNDRADHPINCVDWDQATAYCEWAQKRLPTADEWDKAAFGTDGRKYPWGDEFDSTKLNKNRWLDANGDPIFVDETVPVGSFPAGASPYGALDMAGNTSEWVADLRHEPGSPRRDGVTLRVGPFIFRYDLLNPDYREIRECEYFSQAQKSHRGPGFRCARSK